MRHELTYCQTDVRSPHQLLESMIRERKLWHYLNWNIIGDENAVYAEGVYDGHKVSVSIQCRTEQPVIKDITIVKQWKH